MPEPSTRKQQGYRRGVITRWQQDATYGLITEDSTGQTWVANSADLTVQKTRLPAGTRVTFTGTCIHANGSYPQAHTVRPVRYPAPVPQVTFQPPPQFQDAGDDV